jgi:ATP-dependent protease HslVU (ClpYQ) peptidase subunit
MVMNELNKNQIILVIMKHKFISFLVGTIGNVLVMEIGWTDVGSGGYILVSCAILVFF